MVIHKLEEACQLPTVQASAKFGKAMLMLVRKGQGIVQDQGRKLMASLQRCSSSLAKSARKALEKQLK